VRDIQILYTASIYMEPESPRVVIIGHDGCYLALGGLQTQSYV